MKPCMCILHKNQSKSEEGNEAGEEEWGDENGADGHIEKNMVKVEYILI